MHLESSVAGLYMAMQWDSRKMIFDSVFIVDA